MSSFTTLRVLVTLVAIFVVMGGRADGRPIPSATPYLVSRSPSPALLSTTPTPPLPAVYLAQQRKRAGVYQRKTSGLTKSYGQNRKPFEYKKRDGGHSRNYEQTGSTMVTKRTEASQGRLDMKKRDSDHSHVHEHIHAHNDDDDHDYYHGRHHPDWYAQEEIDHHSKHWAEHHGLLHDDERPYHDHEHIHEHIHEHKREHVSHITTPLRYYPRALIAERGLVGDLVKPLLAPLNVIPGFITISNLLFGDGATDGLLKKLGGLVLHVEATNATSSRQLYSFSLMASKHERTQIYLAPVNQSSLVQKPSDANSTDSRVVKVMLPLLNSTGSPILMCAVYATKPPSALNLEACGDDDESSKAMTTEQDTSQFFTYTPSTGALTPMYSKSTPADDKNNSSNNGTAKATARSVLATPADDQDSPPTTPSPAPTPSSPSNATMGSTSKSKLFMHFVPITMSSSSSNNNNNNSDSADAIATDSEAATADPTMANKDVTSDMPSIGRRNHIPTSVRLALQRDTDQSADVESKPDEESSNSFPASSDESLVNDLNGPLSSEANSDEQDDQPSQIFLAQVNLDDATTDSPTTTNDGYGDGEDSEESRDPSSIPKQSTQYDQFRNKSQATLPITTDCTCPFCHSATQK